MAKSLVIQRKLSRLRSGQPPRFMDLFAGCGGLTLGFTTAGYELVGSVECDPWAAATHAANFGERGGQSSREGKARDITKESPGSIFRSLEISGRVEDQIDVLVGGPPCQAYARVGRAKLRHEAHRRNETGADRAFLLDGRVNLWQRYLHYVRETQPVALLMENVPDILNHGGQNIAEDIASSLRKAGYRVAYTLLNAAWFGVPQIRERMFLIAIHEDLDEEPEFPSPTHFAAIPSGYEGSRATARKLITELFEHSYKWIRDPSREDNLPKATTAGEAFADLPSIKALELLRRGEISRGRKDPLLPVRYVSDRPGSAWSRLMRQWPGFETHHQTTGHVIRYLPRDYKIFNLMEEGWEYPQVWRFVEEKRQRLMEGRWKRGEKVDGRLPEVKELTREWTLPYDPEKFPNKWWKLYRDRPVRTLMAHLGKDSYSHIHFDDEQARTISVREAARLQSFPDGFVLRGTMNPAFRQIGNAVPPLLAYALAMTMRPLIGTRRIPDIRSEYLGLDRTALRAVARG